MNFDTVKNIILNFVQQIIISINLTIYFRRDYKILNNLNGLEGKPILRPNLKEKIDL
jgi:hypothetical protein